LAHDWPGNVRELRNVMERATLLVTGSVLEAEHVMIEQNESAANDELFDADFEAQTAVIASPLLEPGNVEDEKARILRALEACGGNQTRAAKMLGIARRTLINRIEQFNLPRPKKG
jgi:DNA-binding NtrC family response regulator